MACSDRPASYLRATRRQHRNPACSKWSSPVRASIRPRSAMTTKVIQSVSDHSLSGRRASRSRPRSNKAGSGGITSRRGVLAGHRATRETTVGRPESQPSATSVRTQAVVTTGPGFAAARGPIVGLIVGFSKARNRRYRRMSASSLGQAVEVMVVLVGQVGGQPPRLADHGSRRSERAFSDAGCSFGTIRTLAPRPTARSHRRRPTHRKSPPFTSRPSAPPSPRRILCTLHSTGAAETPSPSALRSSEPFGPANRSSGSARLGPKPGDFPTPPRRLLRLAPILIEPDEPRDGLALAMSRTSAGIASACSAMPRWPARSSGSASSNCPNRPPLRRAGCGCRRLTSVRLTALCGSARDSRRAAPPRRGRPGGSSSRRGGQRPGEVAVVPRLPAAGRDDHLSIDPPGICEAIGGFIARMRLFWTPIVFGMEFA